ncbi:MAG: preprotein translocase subunit YajC [Bacteroidetes bacterium]|nr:preprotein translocase subunit YajC [Bacteroidota bacterium]
MHNFLLQAPVGNGAGQIAMILGMIAIFYFFIIRPGQKRAKEARKFRESLAKGDKVVSNGGIHGKVVEVLGDNTVMVDVGSKTNLKIEREALNQSFAPERK